MKRCKQRANQSGQAAMEYLVVCVALALAVGLAMNDDSSVLRQLLTAFASAYKNISYALSIPT